MWYISLADANLYLGTSWQDNLVTDAIDIASGIVDSICYTSFNYNETTEKHKYNGSWPYYLARPIASLLELNGVSIASYTDGNEYIKNGSRIEFDSTILIQEDKRGMISIKYQWGYQTIPQAIQDATRIVLSSVWNAKNAEGISNWTQWDLSIAYNAVAEQTSIAKVKKLLWKYILPRVVS